MTVLSVLIIRMLVWSFQYVYHIWVCFWFLHCLKSVFFLFFNAFNFLLKDGHNILSDRNWGNGPLIWGLFFFYVNLPMSWVGLDICFNCRWRQFSNFSSVLVFVSPVFLFPLSNPFFTRSLCLGAFSVVIHFYYIGVLWMRGSVEEGKHSVILWLNLSLSAGLTPWATTFTSVSQIFCLLLII